MELCYKYQIKKASTWKMILNGADRNIQRISPEEFFNGVAFDDISDQANLNKYDLEHVLRNVNSFFEKGNPCFIDFFINNNIFKFIYDAFLFFGDKNFIAIQTITSMFQKNPRTVDIFVNNDFINLLMNFIYNYVGDDINNIPNERFISNVLKCICLISEHIKFISILCEKHIYEILAKILNDGIDTVYENQDGSDTDIISIEENSVITLSNIIIKSDLIEDEKELNIIKLFIKIIENRKFKLIGLISFFFDDLIIKKKEKINTFYDLEVYNILFDTIGSEENDEETVSFVNTLTFLIDSIYYCNDKEMNDKITSIIDIDTLIQIICESRYALTKKRYINLFSSIILLINNVIAVQKLPNEFDFDFFNDISTQIMENGHIYLKEKLIQLVLTILEVSTIDQVINIVKLDSINLIFESLEDGDFELCKNAINVINNILSKFGKFGPNELNEQYIKFTTEIIPKFLESLLDSSEQYHNQVNTILQTYYSNTIY